MQKTGNLTRYKGARWAIGKLIGGRWVNLVENYPAEPWEIAATIKALGIPTTEVNMYFPKNKSGKQCPSFALMDWFAALPDPKVDHPGARANPGLASV